MYQAFRNGALNYYKMSPPEMADAEFEESETDDVDVGSPFVNGSEAYLYHWPTITEEWGDEKVDDIGQAFDDTLEMGYITHPNVATNDGQLPSNLFVRPSYKRCIDWRWKLMDPSSPNAPKQCLLTGTPGIG